MLFFLEAVNVNGAFLNIFNFRIVKFSNFQIVKFPH